jgi:hypothetical protein
MSTYTSVQQFLDDFKKNYDAATDPEIKNTLAFVRAVALIDKPTDITLLAGKVSEGTITSDMKIDSATLPARISTWLNTKTEFFYDLGTVSSTTTTTTADNMTQLAELLGKCVAGDPLATNECKDELIKLKNTTINFKDLTVPIRVAVQLLKQLGFKAGYGNNWRTSKDQNMFESVENWVQRNKASVDLTGNDFSYLRNVLNVYVRVANNHPESWEDDHASASGETINIHYPVVARKVNNKVVLARLENSIKADTAMLDGMVKLVVANFYSIFGGMTGGGYVDENTYISDVDARSNVYQTGLTLKQFLHRYISMIEAKGGKIETTEKEALIKMADELVNREKSLIQVISLLEKAIALYTFYGKDEVKTQTSLKELENLVAVSEKIFKKVDKGRSSMLNSLNILVNYLP